MSNKFEEMRKRFKEKANKEKSTNTGYRQHYPFYKMNNGEKAVIRFVPDKNKDNDLGFIQEHFYHHVVDSEGKRKRVTCNEQFGEPCPICKVAQEFYNKEDKVNGRMFYKKKEYFTQALIMDDPIKDSDAQGTVQTMVLGPQIFGIICAAVGETSEDLDMGVDPSDYEDGFNFTISKNKKGEYSDYSVGTQFARKQSSLPEDQVELCKESAIDLSTLVGKQQDAEVLEQYIENMLEAGPSSSGGISNSSSSGDSFMDKLKARAATSSSDESNDSDDSSDADDSSASSDDVDPDDVLAKIRNRSKKG